MRTEEYKIGDKVEVLIGNPKTLKDEWRDGEVSDTKMIHPSSRERHKPYPMVMVKTTRTYCKIAENHVDVGDISVFLNYNIEFYDKENTEGFIYDKDIKLKI